VGWIEETFIIDEPRATEPVIRPRARATIGGGGGSAGAGAGSASGGARGAPPAPSPTTMGGSVVGRSGAGGRSLRASAPVAAALPTAPTPARSTAVPPPASVPLTAVAGAGAGSRVPRPLVRPIPSVAIGYEEEYTRFLNMRLVYKPNKGNDTGRVDIPVSTLIDLGMDPLAGRFDLSRFGDTGKCISIHTGYRKGKIAENRFNVEIWLCPKFLATQELATTARHLAPIMDRWTNPVGYFFTSGAWDKMDWYDYWVAGGGADATKNLYDRYDASDWHVIERSKHYHRPELRAGVTMAKFLFI